MTSDFDPFDPSNIFRRADAAHRRLWAGLGGKQKRTVSRLSVTLDPPQATLDGESYTLKPDGALFLDALVKANGEWLTGPKDFRDMDARRVRKALPKRLMQLVQAEAPYGYRIDRSKLS